MERFEFYVFYAKKELEHELDILLRQRLDLTILINTTLGTML